MKKIGKILLLVIAAASLSGCGHWCNYNREYCIEGFTGYTRYPGGMYTASNYYPSSHLTVANALKEGCYMDVTVDRRKMVGKIERGKYELIYIDNKPNENRTVSVLLNEYCGKPGKEKFVDSYEAGLSVSSTYQVSVTWRITDQYFPKSLPHPRRWAF